MKILIWLLCALIYGLIVTVLSYCGITLGGIPTALLAGVLLWISHTLCRRIDSKRASKQQQNESKPNVEVLSANCAPDPVCCPESANGAAVRVSESKLDAWQKEQEHLENDPNSAESIKIEKKAAERTLKDICKPISGGKKRASSKRAAAIIVILSVLSAALLSISIYQCCHYQAELSTKNEQIAELDAKLSKCSKTIGEQANEILKLTSKAEYFDVICSFLSSGNIGYASSNFRADESIIVVNKDEVGRKFTLTAFWDESASVSYSYDSPLSIRPATISFDNSSWQTSTTVTIIPKYACPVIVTFKNDINSETFKILIIVTE